MKATYFFDDPPRIDPASRRALLGGKGAGLALMSSELGLPVPPGFTIPTTLCAVLGSQHDWPPDIEEQVREALQALERRLGRRMGDTGHPMFVSVRSGAPRSMPGMLETVLNVGATPGTIKALARQGATFAWESYCRFLRMYGSIVLKLPGSVEISKDLALLPASERAGALRERLLARVPQEVLDDPWLQLRLCLGAVFRSWNEPKALAYRGHVGDVEDTGTAATVQAMVFGNADSQSGTGIYFTRDPNTGEAQPCGDFIAGAQGEDVVAGTHDPEPLHAFARQMPLQYGELLRAGSILETHLRDMCDIEFTIERGRLWLLQVRAGKRSATAAVRIALDLAEDPRFGMTPKEVLARVAPDTVAALRADAREAVGRQDALVCGLGASPGIATGRVFFTADEAAAAADRGEAVIFAANATSPADVHAFAVSSGILTATGGIVSHAALVAREWGLPAVVGARGMEVGATQLRVGERVVPAGEILTIDGTRGVAYLGVVDTAPRGEDALLSRLGRWCEANGQSLPG